MFKVFYTLIEHSEPIHQSRLKRSKGNVCGEEVENRRPRRLAKEKRT